MRFGDAARSQEEHIDAAFTAMEDGDCRRASLEIAEAKSHGKIRHAELLDRQFRQACPTGIAGLGRLSGRRGRRGRKARSPRAPRIVLPPEAFVPEIRRAPLPAWAYLLGYGAAGFIAYKLLSGPKPATPGGLFGLSAMGGCGACSGSCLGCAAKKRAAYG